jgi:hypothetical protein
MPLTSDNCEGLGGDEARFGWGSTFPVFRDTPPKVIRGTIESIFADAGLRQVRAWDDSIPPLQREIGEVLQLENQAAEYTAIMEYELPLESRRTDVILLARGTVVVLELKGKSVPSQADIDQAAAYARDLRCYHSECANRPVLAVCVPMGASGYLGEQCGVHLAGPDALDQMIRSINESPDAPPLTARAFLSESAYVPLPTLVQAARELFNTGQLRSIWRARAATDPAVKEIIRVIHEAAAEKKRRLILVTGVPGAGKTLVGLRIAHAHFLDDLAVERENGKTGVPAVFLSGNGPLVQVLQYELQGAGGGGKTFVRGVKDYVKRYSGRQSLVPPEHVLIFDEAQRAFDAEQVREKHKNFPGFEAGKSEPEHFIDFAERIPSWCAVLGLIGSGQEIHVGEEAGLVQWRSALEGSSKPDEWIVYGPPQARDAFVGSTTTFVESLSLSLDTEIRFHLASDIHRFVANLLDARPAEENAAIANKLSEASYHLRITRDLECAKAYLHERYSEQAEARFGLLASSKDKDLVRFGVANDFQSTKMVNYGPWYSSPESSSESCRRLDKTITEFGAQGLELDAVLLAWGTDLMMEDGKWSNRKARGYLRAARVKDPFQLRLNAYRVLLTRGRDGTIVFVPPLQELDITYCYLSESGFQVL